jgi:APA family basic amino acid/polyamine antiporter
MQSIARNLPTQMGANYHKIWTRESIAPSGLYPLSNEPRLKPGLFRCKPTAQLVGEENPQSLKRVLNGFHLILLGIGSIVGTGIFVLTGTAAAQHAGPALTISFIFSGAGCLCAGLCYAEFASMIPLSGSAYSYAYATIGELLARTIGWDLILEYMVGAATVATGWSGYAVKLLAHLRLQIPPELSHAPLSFEGEHLSLTGAFLNMPAVFVILLITGLLVVGIQESSLVGLMLFLASLRRSSNQVATSPSEFSVRCSSVPSFTYWYPWF